MIYCVLMACKNKLVCTAYSAKFKQRPFHNKKGIYQD